MNENYGDRITTSKSKTSERIFEDLYDLQKGRMSVSGYFEPDDNLSSTVIIHPNIGYNSIISLYPLAQESSAVAEKFAEIRTSRTQGTCTIKHPIFADGGIFPFMFIVIG
jgi:hypothetical protein